MIRIGICLLLFSFFLGCMPQESIFELDGRQSMILTGKGPGQDGAINPYFGQKSIAVVKNLTNNPFSVRLQKAGKIIQTIPIQKKERKKIVVKKDVEFYLDSDLIGKAMVKFTKFH